MRVCDICKKNSVSYNTTAVVEDIGTVKELELCCKCYNEFHHRECLHRHQAYEEAVKTAAGELPRKFRWWNMFSW